MEQNLLNNPELREKYCNFMHDYLNSKHMELVSTNEINVELSYYMPHHGVFKTSDPNETIRVVFNAPARTTNRLSLNDHLIDGRINYTKRIVLNISAVSNTSSRFNRR